MAALSIGVLLWVVVHLIPSIEQPLRQRLISRLGEKGYKGAFALTVLIALVLIVLGWRSTPEEFLYILPAWSRTVGLFLMILSFILLGAAHYPSLIKSYVRHPMLMGVFFWAASHLLMNGTTRALVLFGGLGLWALLEMPLINRREGEYIKPDAPGFSGEIKGVFISGVIFIVVLMLHPYFAGVTPFPR